MISRRDCEGRVGCAVVFVALWVERGGNRGLQMNRECRFIVRFVVSPCATVRVVVAEAKRLETDWAWMKHVLPRQGLLLEPSPRCHRWRGDWHWLEADALREGGSRPPERSGIDPLVVAFDMGRRRERSGGISVRLRAHVGSHSMRLFLQLFASFLLLNGNGQRHLPANRSRWWGPRFHARNKTT